MVGPVARSAVGDELRLRGFKTIVPEPAYDLAPQEPFWEMHAKSVARGLKSVPNSEGLILTGHSVAGMLLPAISQISGRPIAGYLFVDTDIPEDGVSRLGLLGRESPQAAEGVRQALPAGEMVPAWAIAAPR